MMKCLEYAQRKQMTTIDTYYVRAPSYLTYSVDHQCNVPDTKV